MSENNDKFATDMEKLVKFFEYPESRRKLQRFLEDSCLEYEREEMERTIALEQHEHEIELRGSTPYYRPGHIAPLMYEYLNMIGVEKAFVSGLQHTKASMTKTVQQRVDEVNTLLRGVGGFNRQLKPSFTRSSVVYLEQEDPARNTRERVIFTVNIGDFELKHPLAGEDAIDVTADGRTVRRSGWDFAVNTLSEIVSYTGLKPRYAKNDKNRFHFVLRQDLLSTFEEIPDEFFEFELTFNSKESLEEMATTYKARVAEFESRLTTRTDPKGKKLSQEDYQRLEKDYAFFLGANPDPREMDEGLQFTIKVYTLKDHTLTKDKMQVIMTKYILALSKIATDKSMDAQLATDYSSASADDSGGDGQFADYGITSGKEEVKKAVPVI